MKNITVSIDEKTHRNARTRAAELGTSVSALVRGYLRSLVGDSADGMASSGLEVKRETETELEERRWLLREVIADITANGGGLRMSDNLSREALYDGAINGPNALR